MKKRKVVLNLLLAFVPAMAVLCILLIRSADVSSEADALYAQAAEAVEMGDDTGAEDCLNQLKKEYPDYLPAYELQAERYINEGFFDAAVEVLKNGAQTTGSEYLQQMANMLSIRPQLSVGINSGNEEQGEEFSKDKIANMNNDFIVRYENTKTDRQIQLQFTNLSSDKQIRWTSSNLNVAIVDRNGLLTCGSQPGKAEITGISSDGRYAYCWVYILESEIFAVGNSDRFVYIPEGNFNYLDFDKTDPEKIVSTVRSNDIWENVPCFDLNGDTLLNSGIKGDDAALSGSMDSSEFIRVDENGNPVILTENKEVEEFETAGSIELELGWKSMYFSGEYRIPDHLKANNGKIYTISSLRFSGGQKDISRLYIPITLTSFEIDNRNPLIDLVSLESIEVESGNPSYCSVDGVLYSADGTVLIAYPPAKNEESFVIPDGVTKIGRDAFAASSNSVSLSGNKELQSITIPASVSDIEPDTLTEIQTLKEIKLDPDNESFKMENGFLLDLEGNVIGFSQDSIDVDMVITNKTKELNFDTDKKMETLSVNTAIDTVNIENCTALRSLTINGEVNYLFVMDCPKLEQIVINMPVNNATISHRNNKDLRVTLNASVRSLASYDVYTIENLAFVTDSLYISMNSTADLEIANSLYSLNLSLPADAEINPTIFSGSSIKQLDLTGGKITDLSFISEMSNLQMIGLTEVDVSDWNALWNAPKLTSLDLEDCSGIHDISGVVNLTELTSFGFSGMKVEDISPLASCQHLQQIVLKGTTGLDHLSALVNLPDLSYIALDESDASETDRQAFVDAGCMVR